VLILAIGAKPLMPPIAGFERAVPALAVYFNPEVRIEDHVVMIGGGLVGCEVGLELAHRGKSVTVIEMMERLVANSIGIHRTALLDEMDRYDIRSRVNVFCKKIRRDGVVVEDKNGAEIFFWTNTGYKRSRE
jgi:NADPH-dependent 2,4-dienoyl-CoA reductase/sulfur reductase-like enzyme